MSVLARHNRFFEQVRRSFVMLDYYPALSGAFSLGERILQRDARIQAGLSKELVRQMGSADRHAGLHAEVVWPSAQLVLVVMWALLLPVALVPLWQLAQLELTPAWLNFAPAQVAVVWQVEQSAVVAIWVEPLPVALEPLWHEAQFQEIPE